LPQPRKWAFRSSPYSDIGSAWFLGDCLFYSRMAYPGHLLIGFERIDAAKRTVIGGSACLEVAEKQQAEAYAAAAMPVVIRVGDYVLWVNTGYDNAFRPDAVGAEWKRRRVRALDLTSGQIVDFEKIPEKVLRENRERFLALLEKEIHNHSPELEVWAVGVIARFGDAKDAKRLRALVRTIRKTENQVQVNEQRIELRITDAVVKKAYAEAVAALEKKGRQ